MRSCDWLRVEGVLAGSELYVVLPVATATQPAHIKRRGVIVVVGNCVCLAASPARLSREAALVESGAD